MAQEIADVQDVTPQEALLGLVRTASARAAWTDTVVASKMRRHVAGGGDPADPPDEVERWLKVSRDERLVAMRTSKAAVDAGVMQALERRIDMEADVVGVVVEEVVNSVGEALAGVLSVQQKRDLFDFSWAVAKWRLLQAGEQDPGPRPVVPVVVGVVSERSGEGLDDEEEGDGDE